MEKPFLHVETRTGEPILVGDTTIIPYAQIVQVKLPRINAGIIWQRPLSVSVQTADGQTYRQPVRDVTRLIQVLLVGVVLVAALVTWRLYYVR